MLHAAVVTRHAELVGVEEVADALSTLTMRYKDDGGDAVDVGEQLSEGVEFVAFWRGRYTPSDGVLRRFITGHEVVDAQYEYICNVIQWVENNLDAWRLKAK